jgi:hypothetical protein
MTAGTKEQAIMTEPRTYARPDSGGFSIRWILLALLAVTPILQHYEGIFVNPSLGITSAAALIALVWLLMRKIKVNTAFVLLAAYGVYAAVIHGVEMTHFLREMVQLVIYLAVLNGFFDMMKLRKFCCIIAVCATILIIIQYFCYYVLGFHLQLVAIPLLKQSNSQWFDLIRTGMIGVNGKKMSFYRPSAFFLEPSHFAIYCIPVIVTTLFSRTGDKPKQRLIALFVSVGVFLSTSGMGIGVVAACWGLYLLFFYGQKGKARTMKLSRLLDPRSVALFAVLLVVIVGLYAFVPVFRKSVSRIFNLQGMYKTSAIAGRTSTGMRSLKMLDGIQILVGVGDKYDISDWNMAAFFFVTFKFGALGAVLFYSFYIYSLFKLRREAQILAFIFLPLSFFTVHMFGAYYKMFYTMIMLYGYVQNRLENMELASGNLQLSDIRQQIRQNNETEAMI